MGQDLSGHMAGAAFPGTRPQVGRTNKTGGDSPSCPHVCCPLAARLRTVFPEVVSSPADAEIHMLMSAPFSCSSLSRALIQFDPFLVYINKSRCSNTKYRCLFWSRGWLLRNKNPCFRSWCS